MTHQAEPAQPAVSIQAAQAEVLGNDEASMHLQFDASATGGALSSLEVRLRAGANGAGPHFHARSSELFYVVEGELRVLAGEQVMTVAAGGSLVVPKFMPHAFGATPDSAARVLIVLTPGVERFEYFRLLRRIQAGEAAPEQLAAAQDKFDNYFVDSPQWRRDRNGTRTPS